MAKKLNWNPAPEGVRWNRLRSLRKERNLSQVELAAGADISLSIVYFLESGFEERTSPEIKKKIADFFEVDVSDVFPAEMIGDEPRSVFFERMRSQGKAK